MEIDWDSLEKGQWTWDINQWSQEDKKLASLAVAIYRHLNKRISKLEPLPVDEYGITGVEPFVKIPGLASGISQAIWFGPKDLTEHLREVVGTALVLEQLGKIPN